MNTQQHTLTATHSLVKAALITALYVALTFVVAPIAFGPIQFRLSEGLNFLGLYNKRYIYAITLGVMLVNFYQYGIMDVLVGGGSTFVFLWLSRWLGEMITTKMRWIKLDPMIVKYITLIIVFSLSMFTIALMLVLIGAEQAFWPVYISLVVSEAVVLILTAFAMYPISKRVNFDE